MLIGGRCLSKPGVVCDGHQKIGPFPDKSPAEVRKDDLETDEDTKFPLGKGKIDNVVPGFEIADSLSQRTEL